MAGDASLDNLVIEIDAIDSSAIASLGKLSDSLKTLKAEINGAAGANFDALGNGFHKLADSIASIDDAKLQKVKDFANTLQGLSTKFDFGDTIKSFESFKIDPEALESISKLAEQTKTILKPFEDLHTVLVNVDKELKLKPKDMNGVSVGLKDMEKKVKKSTSAFGKLSSMFKRMMMLKAVRAILSEITQGIREGLDNAYAFSGAIDGNLAKSLDNISSVSLKMKNQAGSAFGELLRAIEPAIVKISELVTNLADMISRLIAMFNGSDTYLKATDVETTWNDGTKAVKEYKKQLLGLDELNVLNDQKSNTGTGTLNAKKMFEEVKVDSGIDKGTFADMQRVVGAVKDAVGSIIDLLQSPAFRTLADIIGTILKEGFILAIGTIGDVAKLVKNVLSGDWAGALDAILAWGEKASNFIDNLGGKIFGDKWEQYKTDLGDFVGDLQKKIAKVFDTLYESFHELGVMFGIIDDYEVGKGNTKERAGQLTDLQKKWVREHPFEAMPEYIKNDTRPIQQQSPEWYAQQYSGKGGAGTSNIYPSSSTVKLVADDDAIFSRVEDSMNEFGNRVGSILGIFG